MLMKFLTALFIFSMIGMNGYCQSKKNQIEALNSKLDSLNNLLLDERSSNNDLTMRLNDSIKFYKRNFNSLQTKNAILESDNVKKTNELEKLKIELNNKNNEVSNLRAENTLIQDSLKIIKSFALQSSVAEESEDDCWAGAPLIDTLYFSHQKKLLITPIDSIEFLSGSNCKEINYFDDEQIVITKQSIKCSFRNGKSKTFRNNLGPQNGEYYDSYMKYTSYGSMQEIDYYLLMKENPFLFDFLLIDRENGTEINLCSMPILSNNKKYLICHSPGFCEGLNLQIFEVMVNGKIKPLKFDFNCEWGPEKINFLGDNELLIKKTIDCASYRYGKLILN